jgi:hypothetical protein
MQVRFKTIPDPNNPEGLIVTFETVGSLVENVSPFAVTFKNQSALDSAFLAARIYLRDVSHPDPERSQPPNPEKIFEVTADTLRTIGFDIPRMTSDRQKQRAIRVSLP